MPDTASICHEIQRPIDGSAVAASLVMTRVGNEISTLALAVEELQSAFSSPLTRAAAVDEAIMLRSQELDLVAQSLRSLATFLKAFEGRQIGHESLDIEGAAKSLSLASLGRRLAGRSSSSESFSDFEIFSSDNSVNPVLPVAEADVARRRQKVPFDHTGIVSRIGDIVSKAPAEHEIGEAPNSSSSAASSL